MPNEGLNGHDIKESAEIQEDGNNSEYDGNDSAEDSDLATNVAVEENLSLFKQEGFSTDRFLSNVLVKKNNKYDNDIHALTRGIRLTNRDLKQEVRILYHLVYYFVINKSTDEYFDLLW